MAVHAVVREWRDDEGWGVVDSPETPGGCWAHYSHIATDAAGSYRTARAGQEVMLEWEPADQDGFEYRAIRLWPTGDAPAAAAASEGSPAFQTSLTLTFDDPTPPVDH